MAPSITLTVRLDRSVRDGLDALSRSTKRSKSYLAAEAIARYLEVEAWQVAHIKAAIAAADEGTSKGIPHEEVERWLASWGTPDELPPLRCK